MQRRIIIGLVLIVLAAMACSPASPPPTPTTAAKAATASPTAAKPAASSPATPPPAQVKLKVGIVGTMSDGANLVAYKKGYFKEQGIDVEFIRFDTGAKMIAPLGTGELDAGRGVIGAGLFNAVLRGLDIKVVADAYSSPSTKVTKDYAGIVVRKDLADQIKTEKDLKGKNVAITGKGIAAEIELQKLLEKGGLTDKDINLSYIGHADGLAALASKSLDVYVGLSEPFLTSGMDKNIISYWMGFPDVYPGHTFSVLLYSSKLAKETPEVAKRYMEAYLKGIRDYYDAFFKNKNKKEVVAILAEMTDIKDVALYDSMVAPNVNPDGYVSVETVATDAKWFFDSKQIDKPVEVKQVVDNSFLDSAIQRLGKYK